MVPPYLSTVSLMLFMPVPCPAPGALRVRKPPLPSLFGASLQEFTRVTTNRLPGLASTISSR